MAELIDMSAPVTRGELREELTVVRTELREEIASTRSELREEIAQLRIEARTNLEIWGGALLARIDAGFANTDARFARIDARFDATRKDLDSTRKDLEAMEQRLGIDLARHVKAIQESLSVQVSVVDEKYADLPDRVTRLESKP